MITFWSKPWWEPIRWLWIKYLRTLYHTGWNLSVNPGKTLTCTRVLRKWTVHKQVILMMMSYQRIQQHQWWVLIDTPYMNDQNQLASVYDLREKHIITLAIWIHMWPWIYLLPHIKKGNTFLMKVVLQTADSCTENSNITTAHPSCNRRCENTKGWNRR